MTNTCPCGRPTEGPTLCESCSTTFSFAVANVGVYFADLGTVASKRTRSGGIATRGSVGKTQPLPIDMRFVDAGPPPDDDKSGRPRAATIAPGTQLRWDVVNTVDAWCRSIMAAQPRLAGPACRPGDCLHTSCADVRRLRWPDTRAVPSMLYYIARQLRWLINQAWAPSMMDEFLDLERRLKRMVDTKPSTWYAGRCSAPLGNPNEPDDDAAADDDTDGGPLCPAELYATTDRGTIDCPSCGTRHDVADRRDFLLEQAKDYLVTATEAAGALLAWTDYDGSEKKLVDRIGKWHERKRITDHGSITVAGRNRPIYRLGDLQDQLVEEAQSRQTKRIGGAA